MPPSRSSGGLFPASGASARRGARSGTDTEVPDGRSGEVPAGVLQEAAGVTELLDQVVKPATHEHPQQDPGGHDRVTSACRCRRRRRPRRGSWTACTPTVTLEAWHHGGDSAAEAVFSAPLVRSSAWSLARRAERRAPFSVSHRRVRGSVRASSGGRSRPAPSVAARRGRLPPRRA